MSTTKRSSKHLKVGMQAKSRQAIEPDAPFEREILDRAQQIAAGYRFVVRPSETLGYTGHTLEMPLVLAHGPTPEECLRAVMFAVETAVAAMLEAGQTPPAAAVKRTEQINVRLTSEEKLLLEEESQRKGYKGLSDFVRAAALAQASGAGAGK